MSWLCLPEVLSGRVLPSQLGILQMGTLRTKRGRVLPKATRLRALHCLSHKVWATLQPSSPALAEPRREPPARPASSDPNQQGAATLESETFIAGLRSHHTFSVTSGLTSPGWIAHFNQAQALWPVL